MKSLTHAAEPNGNMLTSTFGPRSQPDFTPEPRRWIRPFGAHLPKYYRGGVCRQYYIAPVFVPLNSKSYREVELVKNPGHTSGWKQVRKCSAAANTDPCQPQIIRIRKGISSGSLLPIVSMMQAADARERDHTAIRQTDSACTRRFGRLGAWHAIGFQAQRDPMQRAGQDR
jgi:hypothetical protein